MVDAAKLIREARLAAGLTQSELARRMGTTQSAVARLERSGSNPRVNTLRTALTVCGRTLDLGAAEWKPGTDERQIASTLRLTPAERLSSFEVSYANVRKLALPALG